MTEHQKAVKIVKQRQKRGRDIKCFADLSKDIQKVFGPMLSGTHARKAGIGWQVWGMR